MVQPYKQKELLITNHFANKATVDNFADAFAYMNCITVEDFSFSDECQDNIQPTYIVTSSDNDDIEKGDLIEWSVISEYIDRILSHGCKDDIECLYNHCFWDNDV